METLGLPVVGWTTAAEVIRCIDGDTVEVQVRKIFRVRLLDCWAPETHLDSRVRLGKRAASKEAGIQSRNNLEKLIGGKEVLVEIPASVDGEFTNSISLGRVLGRIWLPGDPVDVSAKQVAAGHATKQKPEELM